ncbi:MAG: tetratricopeptide repeat protein [Saprospiraceae bacterium]|nr:tetratricopeptide repeat protein [Saprospiraceae bacterium]
MAYNIVGGSYIKVFLIGWLTVLILASAYSQTNFRARLEKADPVEEVDSPVEKKIEIHQEFLHSALLHSNAQDILFAHLLLSSDYMDKLDYESVAHHLNEAEMVCFKSNRSGDKGWVKYRKGILQLRLKEYESALRLYLDASDLCLEARDSLCVGETWEQASVMYAILDSIEQAFHYHALAMPLLKNFGSLKQLASANNNFGSVLTIRGEFDRAKDYLNLAMEEFKRLEDRKSALKTKNNLANVYRVQHSVDDARRLYYECIDSNLKYGFTENLVSNYRGIYRLLQDHGFYQDANEYIDLYYEIRDSLANNDIKQKLSAMELELAKKQSEYLFEKNRSELAEARYLSMRNKWLALFAVSMLLFLVGYVIFLRRQTGREMLQNKESLMKLSNLLMQKNLQIRTLKAESSYSGEADEMIRGEALMENIYDVRILTDMDWLEFKGAFEKVYPNFIQKLRHRYPILSEGDERLSLLIKLSLSSKEIAAILGISKDSVKKSRQRLRKKMDLEKEDDLLQKINEIR